MLGIMILSITSFIGTNIDDMVINTFFFASAKSNRDVHSIVAGKYIGIGALVLLSAAGALGLGFLPGEYVRYLGLVPIGLGIKELLGNCRECEEDDYGAGKFKSGRLAAHVALVTIANGADNIGVYIPLFASFEYAEYAVFSGVFVLMTGLWCVLGYQASRLSFSKKGMERYKKGIVPAVYILLGIYILVKATS